MLQSRVISEASFTFLSIRLINGFMSIERAFQIQGFFLLFLTSFIFQVSYPYLRICDNDEPG